MEPSEKEKVSDDKSVTEQIVNEDHPIEAFVRSKVGTDSLPPIHSFKRWNVNRDFQPIIGKDSDTDSSDHIKGKIVGNIKGIANCPFI